jgi:hypothetical protein
MSDRWRFPRGGVALIMTLITSSTALRWAAVTVISDDCKAGNRLKVQINWNKSDVGV